MWNAQFSPGEEGWRATCALPTPSSSYIQTHIKNLVQIKPQMRRTFCLLLFLSLISIAAIKQIETGEVFGRQIFTISTTAATKTNPFLSPAFLFPKMEEEISWKYEYNLNLQCHGITAGLLLIYTHSILYILLHVVRVISAGQHSMLHLMQTVSQNTSHVLSSPFYRPFPLFILA